MKIINKLILAVAALSLVSCSTKLFNFGNKETFKIESRPPKASVYKYEKKNKSFVKIGETPIEIKKEELDQFKDFSAFKIEKTGYVVEHILFDKNSKSNIDYLISLKAVETWSDQDAEVSSKLAGDIAKKVQYINRLILRRKLNEALNLAKELVNQYPKAHTFYDIKGSIYLLKGDKNQGIASLKKSLVLNPENIETEKLLKVLQGR